MIKSKKICVIVVILYLVIARHGLAKIKTVEIYRNVAFIEEFFEFSQGKHEIPLLGIVPHDQITVYVKDKRFKILSISFREGKNSRTLAKRLENLKKEKEKLLCQIKILEKKISLIETAISGKRDLPPISSLEEYLNFLDTLQQSIEKTKERLSCIEEEIASLTNKVGSENTTLVTLVLTGPQGDKTGVVIHYPAKGILSIRNLFEVYLYTISKRVVFSGRTFIIQRSGEDWQDVTLIFYPRQKSYISLSPPPFSPWYLDLIESPIRFGKMPKSKTLGIMGKAEGLQTVRETSPASIWERIKAEGLTCPTGEETSVWLGREELPVTKFVIEVPAYARNMAYFRTDLLPKISIPETRAVFYVDGAYVGMGYLRRLIPGKRASLYFGEAHLVEVKRETLKDTTGKAHIFGSREKIEKIFKTTIINHYPRKMPIVLIDRIPVSKRKEIKVNAEAVPEWDNVSPEGKATWSFDLEPEEKREVILKIQINRPKKE